MTGLIYLISNAYPAIARPAVKNITNPADDPIGELYLAGTTWCDVQHWGSCGRMIQVDSGGWMHMVWMKGLNSGASQRHIFYQLYDPSLMQFFTGGIQVDQSLRTGFPNLALHSDNRAMPCFQQRPQHPNEDLLALSFDYFPRTGAFGAANLPYIFSGGSILPLTNLIIAKDINDRYHIVSTEDLDSTSTTLVRKIFYCGAMFNPSEFEITFDPEQIQVGITTTISADIASSPVSERTAIGWLQPCATQSDTNLYDNDLIICISQDGVEWDFNDTINVTNWIPPELVYLPDTATANRDTLRCFTDMCLLFDNDDILHVFFTTIAYHAIQNVGYPRNSFIWHWDEFSQKFSLVASGWYENGGSDPGYLNAYVQRPSAGVDEYGQIYCIYQRYLAPVYPMYNFPYYYADTSDFSLGGYPNSEIWISRANNSGFTCLYWEQGAGITNTHTPSGGAGMCQSEISPSLAPVVDDYCHLIYVLDKDAGAVEEDEGGWTNNDVLYQRIPTDDIPITPLLNTFPMHCDSTGMPINISPPTYNLNVTLYPQPPQIVIPDSGGNVLFDITVRDNWGFFCQIDVWVYLMDPAFNTEMIYIQEEVSLNPGQIMYFNDIMHYIEESCPAGTYTVSAIVGIWSLEVIWDYASFTFEKSPAAGVEFGAVDKSLPDKFQLFPAFPNPFNAETVIAYDVPTAGDVELKAYNICGREISVLAEGWKEPGHHSAFFDGEKLPSGIYLVRMSAAGYSAVEKMALIK